MDDPTATCPRCCELAARVTAIEKPLAELTAALEAVQRAGKRQAAPFRKSDGPAAGPKTPGRKRGREHGFHAHRVAPVPNEVDGAP